MLTAAGIDFFLMLEMLNILVFLQHMYVSILIILIIVSLHTTVMISAWQNQAIKTLYMELFDSKTRACLNNTRSSVVDSCSGEKYGGIEKIVLKG